MRVGSVRCCLLLLLEDEIPLRVGKSLLDPEEEEEVATLGDCQSTGQMRVVAELEAFPIKDLEWLRLPVP